MSAVELGFRATAKDVVEARHFTRYALRAWGLASDDVALVVSELANNALRHSGSGFSVALERTDDAVRVEVTDASDVMLQRLASDGRERRGWGLMIVEHLARSWGVRPAPGDGKTVWAEVVLPVQ